MIVLWRALYAKLWGLNLIFMRAQTCICLLRRHKHMSLTECENSPSHKYINMSGGGIKDFQVLQWCFLCTEAAPQPGLLLHHHRLSITDGVWDKNNRCHHCPPPCLPPGSDHAVMTVMDDCEQIQIQPLSSLASEM